MDKLFTAPLPMNEVNSSAICLKLKLSRGYSLELIQIGTGAVATILIRVWKEFLLNVWSAFGQELMACVSAI